MVKIVITWLEFPNLETSIDSGDFWYPTECRNYRPTAPDKMWMLQLKYYYESLRSIKRAGCKDMVQKWRIEPRRCGQVNRGETGKIDGRATVTQNRDAKNSKNVVDTPQAGRIKLVTSGINHIVHIYQRLNTRGYNIIHILTITNWRLLTISSIY